MKQNTQKRIIKRKKKQQKFDIFHEETQKPQENGPEHKSTFKRLDSNISMGCKTIYAEHSKHSSKNIILKMNEIINDYPEKYYKQHLKSEWVYFFANLFTSFLHIIIIILYINSINACSKSLTLDECIDKIDILYYNKVYLLCFLTAFLISLILILIIVKLISIYHSPFIIIELCFFIFINHENNIYSNGLYSLKLLFSFIVITFLFLFFFILFLIRLGKKEYFYSVIFFFAFHLLLQYIYLFIYLVLVA